MPLIICTIFFAVLFSCEALFYCIQQDREQAQLRRYQEVEHPRRSRSDRYLDQI